MLFIFGVVIFAILIGVLSFLYLYELLGRTTMLEELHQKAVLITGCGGGGLRSISVSSSFPRFLSTLNNNFFRVWQRVSYAVSA